MSLPLKNNNKAPISIGIIFFIICTIIRFIALNQTSYANGWDGYYYVMQAHSFLEYGHLQSPDYSLIYPYFIICSYAISDYELAFKIGTAILSAFFTYSSFKITYIFSKKNIHLAILVGAVTIFSPGITFFTSQFPKNLLGLIFISWVPLFIIHKQYAKAIIFIVLSALTHRMTGGIGILLLIISLLTNIPKKYIGTGLLVILIISFLPGIFHISDFERFNGQLSQNIQLASFGFLNLGIIKHQLIWKIEVYFATIISIVIFFYIIIQSVKNKKTPPKVLMILLLLFLVFFPFFKLFPGSMGYRFFLLIFLLYPILLGIILTKLNLTKQALIFTSGILLMCSLHSYKSYNPNYHDAPNELYHQMASEIVKRYDDKKYPLIIAHKSLAEVIIYKTNFDALNWSPPSAISTQKVLRIVEGVPFRFIEKYIDNDSEILHLSTLYIVLPEKTWKIILEKATKDNNSYLLDLIYTGNNPMKTRPEYLKKGKKV